jgi:ribosomal protein L9
LWFNIKRNIPLGGLIMKILMLKDLKKVGKKGEVVNVSDGYGANYIIPQGYGRVYNEEAKRAYAEEKKQEAIKLAEDKQKAEDLKAEIEKVEIKFEASVGRNGYMIGQISAKQIEQALKAKGLIVDKRKFVDFSPVTYFGHGKVKVELFKGVIAEINVYIVEKAK